MRLRQRQQLRLDVDVVGGLWMQLLEPKQMGRELLRTWRDSKRVMQPAEPEGHLADPRGYWSVSPLSTNQVSERDSSWTHFAIRDWDLIEVRAARWA
jgi:hypothetical protein